MGDNVYYLFNDAKVAFDEELEKEFGEIFDGLMEELKELMDQNRNVDEEEAKQRSV